MYTTERTFLRSEVFCPNGIGGGAWGCRTVGFLDSVCFSVMQGIVCRPFESRDLEGSRTMMLVLLTESGFGGASSESEVSQFSERTGAGG